MYDLKKKLSLLSSVSTWGLQVKNKIVPGLDKNKLVQVWNIAHHFYISSSVW